MESRYTSRRPRTFLDRRVLSATMRQAVRELTPRRSAVDGGAPSALTRERSTRSRNGSDSNNGFSLHRETFESRSRRYGYEAGLLASVTN